MSKKTNVWMPLYIADYLADTTRLTTEQHGAYLLLIMDYWRNGPLPDDDGSLANITRLSMPQWKKHRPVLARLFLVEGGEWLHKRVDTELQAAAENAAKHEERAKKAAAARWSKESKSNASSNATSTPQEQLEECPSPSPSPKPTTEGKPSFVGEARNRTREAALGTTVPADFEPDQSHRGIAHNMGLDLQAERDKFVDHYTSTGEVLAEWPAKFRNWLRNANKHGDSKFQQQTTRRTASSSSNLTDHNRAAAERAKAMLFGDGNQEDIQQ
ncbi:YdaU family protein [Aquitalea aquatilis]|uniref:YdaU family protein n=1 Tax=Aquitalea aquatilis TaxID=1537400 RepID=UPI00143D94F8|nr:DUF1376 domain-containing protein [Aquitalea aquatilis]